MIEEYESMMMFDLSDGERAQLSLRMESLADSFAALEQIDTDSVEPLISVLELHNVLREDVPAKFVTREELLSNAPEQLDGYFKVPGTL